MPLSACTRISPDRPKFPKKFEEIFWRYVVANDCRQGPVQESAHYWSHLKFLTNRALEQQSYRQQDSIVRMSQEQRTDSLRGQVFHLCSFFGGGYGVDLAC